ncbi:MAG: hypothetical protein WAW27_06160, partial [Chitinophagaceae bacterium]
PSDTRLGEGVLFRCDIVTFPDFVPSLTPAMSYKLFYFYFLTLASVLFFRLNSDYKLNEQ